MLCATNLQSNLKKNETRFTRFSYSEAFHSSPLLVFKALLKLALTFQALCLTVPLIHWLLPPNQSVVHSGFHLISTPWPQAGGLSTSSQPFPVLWGGTGAHIPPQIPRLELSSPSCCQLELGSRALTQHSGAPREQKAPSLCVNLNSNTS